MITSIHDFAIICIKTSIDKTNIDYRWLLFCQIVLYPYTINMYPGYDPPLFVHNRKMPPD